MTTAANIEHPTSGTKHRVPEFFVVGNPKSGTTALYEMLVTHPQVYMPKLGSKFFALEQKRKPDTLEEYLSLFDPAKAGQRIGEMSRGYLRSPTAASGIAEVNPDARIVAVLREPASFLRSLHLELLQDHVETEKDLGRLIAREEAGGSRHDVGESGVPRTLGFSKERVAYVDQLRRFHAVFPREQVLVLIYDDFRADNEGTVRDVLRFLEVDDTISVEAKDANPTILVRSPKVHGLLRSVSLGNGAVAQSIKTSIKATTGQRLRRRALSQLRRRVLYAEAPPVDPALMTQIRRRSHDEVVALSKYLDRDLVALWGYDRL
jgi:hypothetical protein